MLFYRTPYRGVIMRITEDDILAFFKEGDTDDKGANKCQLHPPPNAWRAAWGIGPVGMLSKRCWPEKYRGDHETVRVRHPAELRKGGGLKHSDHPWFSLRHGPHGEVKDYPTVHGLKERPPIWRYDSSRGQGGAQKKGESRVSLIGGGSKRQAVDAIEAVERMMLASGNREVWIAIKYRSAWTVNRRSAKEERADRVLAPVELDDDDDILLTEATTAPTADKSRFPSLGAKPAVRKKSIAWVDRKSVFGDRRSHAAVPIFISTPGQARGDVAAGTAQAAEPPDQRPMAESGAGAANVSAADALSLLPAVTSTLGRMSVAPGGANRRMSTKAANLLAQLAQELGVEAEPAEADSTDEDAEPADEASAIAEQRPARAPIGGEGIGDVSRRLISDLAEISQRLIPGGRNPAQNVPPILTSDNGAQGGGQGGGARPGGIVAGT